MLADSISEMKWNFELVDALKRAKTNRGQLFAGKVFYVTNNVPLDKKLLKNVILAHGGQVSRRGSSAQKWRTDRFVVLARTCVWVTDTSAKSNRSCLERQIVWPATLRDFVRRRRLSMATYRRSWARDLLPRTRTQRCSHAGDAFE